MNLNIKTAEFWQKTKKSFENSNGNHLCPVSVNFYEVWQWRARRYEILEFAREFLKVAKGFDRFQCGDAYLFINKDWHSVTDEERRAVRLEFIDYMITKTQHT